MKKKFLAALLTSTMVMGMTLGVNAEEMKKPEASDTAIATIKNVEEGATIKVYQIVDAHYNDRGFVKYVREIGITETNLPSMDAYTYEQIMELAKLELPEYNKLENPIDPENADVEWTYDATNKQYTTALEAGMYLVKIGGTNAKIYNPMIIGIGYDQAGSGSSNQLTTGEVDVDVDKWTTLEGATISAKSSDITATKDVNDAEAEVDGIVEFTINTTIPSFSTDNEEVKFNVIDRIVNGLDYVEENGVMVTPVVKVNDAELDASKYTFTPGTDTFTIAFNSEYVMSLAGTDAEDRAVEITYEAVVTEDAITEVGENVVSLNYTTAPDQEITVEKDREYVYTLTLNGVFDKVNEENEALSGATFELYRGVDREEAVVDETAEVKDEVFNDGYSLVNGVYVKYFDTSISSEEDGSLLFEGLDADETYYLKETAAPAGYTLNEHVYTITFDKLESTDNDEIYDQYDVYVDGNKTGTIKYGSALDADDAVQGNSVTMIPNTKIIALPSTGGIGTTIFTVAGCAIMIGAAGFFFATRKKEEE